VKPARQSVVIPLPVEDEWPHPPGDEWDWQESVVLCFQDLHHRVGGFIRIGHHPNRNTGNLTFGVVTPEGGYNRSAQDLPMRDGDRSKRGFALDGFVSAIFDEASSAWRAEDAECAIDLRVTNFHPLYDTWALSGLTGGFRDKFAASHTEAPGAVSGTVRVGQQTWSIQGFAYRDHSWGVRHMDAPESALANFFWLVGSFGDDFVFAVTEIITAAAKTQSIGYIIKDGVFDLPTALDASFLVDLDGVSLRGASCRFETAKLGTFDFQVEGFGNVLLGMERKYLEFGMPGVVTWNGRRGGAHLSTLFNARGGSASPPRLFGAESGNGLYSKRSFRETLDR
jgi:hypothetical protein